MRSIALTCAIALTLTACTGDTTLDSTPPPTQTTTTPGQTPPTPAVRTFELEVGQSRLNLKPSAAHVGDIVRCVGMQVRVSEPGTHRGESDGVWVNTASNGSVSMGCRTPVAWGHREPQEGLIIGPSNEWADSGTVALWVADDDVFLAVVHGTGGFYALDLRGIQDCPLAIRGEGQGEHIDPATQDIVFECADGSVWARFDPYGQPVEDAPSRLPRPAFEVKARGDGTLLVTKTPTPLPLSAYWP